MKTQCPFCAFVQHVPKEYRQKVVKCKECGKDFTAEKAQTALAVQATRVPSPSSLEQELTSLVAVKKRKPKARYLRSVILAGSVVLFISLLLAGYYGYCHGWKKGFGDGGDATMEVVRILATDLPKTNRTPPYSYYTSNSPPWPSGIITAKSAKIIKKGQYFWTISWKIEYESWVFSNMDISFYFYDENGYLLHSEYLYNKNVYKDFVHTFTDTALVESSIARKIAYIDAEVEK